MQVHDIEAGHGGGQRAVHRRRPVEAPQPLAGEIGDLDAFEIDRPLQRHLAVSRTVDARRKDMNVVAVGRQRPTERMNRTNWAAIPDCGKVSRNDVKNAQGEAATR